MMDSRCYALMIMAVSFGPRGTGRAALLGIRLPTARLQCFLCPRFSFPDEAEGFIYVIINH